MKRLKKEIEPLKDISELLNWYESLGWNGKTQLAPTKIMINRKAWHLLCSNLETGELMTYVNYGPSSKDATPDDCIDIYKGAF